jgi:hypothetical protein
MGTFGTPTYEEEQKPQNGNGTAAVGAEYIDPNDPLLTSESLTDDVTADAYKIPPPAPDGFWRAKLKSVPIKDTKGAMVPFMAWRHEKVNDGKPMFVANAEVSLIDLSGKFDGTRITEQWVKSNIDKRKGTSQMTTIIVKAGGTAPSPSTERQRLDAFLKTLAGEPEVIVETFWEASCMKCGETADKKDEKRPGPFLRGMHRFPQVKGPTGALEADPIVPCPVCKSSCRAQVRVATFHRVGDQKATRGLA